jgi:hypothetical protein
MIWNELVQAFFTAARRNRNTMRTLITQLRFEPGASGILEGTAT